MISFVGEWGINVLKDPAVSFTFIWDKPAKLDFRLLVFLLITNHTYKVSSLHHHHHL